MNIALHQACAAGSLALLNRIWCHSQRPRVEGSPWCPAVSLQTNRHYKRWQFSQSLIQAIRRRDLVIVNWILGRFTDCVSDLKVVEEAASTGQLDILKVLLDEDNRSWEAFKVENYDGYYNAVEWGGTDMAMAVRNGHSDVVRWLLDHTSSMQREQGVVLYEAVLSGNLPIVQLLISRSFPVYDPRHLASIAAMEGHFELLQWLVEHQLHGEKNCVRLSGRHLNVNKWLVDSNLECDAEEGLIEACGEGLFPVVKWLTDYYNRRGALFSSSKAESAMISAAINGHLEVVKWLVERHFSVRRIIHVIYFATERGRLEVVKYLHEQGFTSHSKETLERAAKGGHLAVVQWLWTQFKDDPEADLLRVHGGDQYSSRAAPLARELTAAARKGHLKVVQYLHTIALRLVGKRIRGRGFRYPAKPDMDNVVTEAARSGHLDVVRWVCTHTTVNSTKDAMASAAGNGHFSVVRWLHENRPREDFRTAVLDAAAGCRDLSLLKWLHTNRPNEGWSTVAINIAARRGHLHVLRWLIGHESLYDHDITNTKPGAMTSQYWNTITSTYSMNMG